MSTHPARRSWTAAEAQGATFVELFFDLVFVFAVTSVTGLLVHDLTWAGVYHGILILWLVWWAWTQFTWTLNPADTGHPAVQLITLASAAAAFFMAEAIPDAFSDAGTWFAVAYVTVRLLGLGLQLGLLGSLRDNAGALVAWLTGSGIGLVVVLAGGLVAPPWREILWTAALVLDLLSAARAGRGRWHLHAAHFAERHGLIVIIALGESLIAAGVTLGEMSRDAVFAIGAISAVAGVCALWWIYFTLAKDDLEEHLATRTDDEVGGEARNIYSWGHLPIIAGIITFAVGIEEALAHPDEALALEGLAALALGVVLYLGGIAYGLQRSGRRSPVPWMIAAAATIVVLVVARTASGLAQLTAVTVVLIGFATWGSWSRRPMAADSGPSG